jgi:hypothetical protein
MLQSYNTNLKLKNFSKKIQKKKLKKDHYVTNSKFKRPIQLTKKNYLYLFDHRRWIIIRTVDVIFTTYVWISRSWFFTRVGVHVRSDNWAVKVKHGVCRWIVCEWNNEGLTQFFCPYSPPVLKSNFFIPIYSHSLQFWS